MSETDPQNPITVGVAKGLISAATKRMEYILGAVIFVLFIGFITLLVAVISPIVDAWRFRTETYQNLVNQVNIENNKIDTLTNELQRQGKIPTSANKAISSPSIISNISEPQ